MLKWFTQLALVAFVLTSPSINATADPRGHTNGKPSLIYTDDPFASADPYGLSPFWTWKTIETENFRITYPEELRPLAQKAANYLEEAESFLSPLLHWKPQDKIQILVIDNQDSANGITSAFTRFGIILWVTPPDTTYGTGYYDDWLRLLCIHELTHYLNMDTTTNFWSLLRPIFGDTLLPNTLWPPWMLEGLAVYMETRFTTAGRGRSPYYDMVLRTAINDGVFNTRDFITLDKLNGPLPYFPDGDTRYLFGYQLMNAVSQYQGPNTHHDEILGTLSEKSGGRIPFFINGNLENITGKDWYAFWDQWVAQTTKRITDDLNKIKSKPLTRYTFLTDPKYEDSNQVTGAAVSPNGKWIAYTLSSANWRSGLYIKDLTHPETPQRRLSDKLNGIGIQFTPDSKSLIYSRLQRSSIYYLYSDLEVYSLETGSQYLLTNALRARDPDVSKNGKWVTFTLTEKGVTGLALASLIQENKRYKLGPIQKVFMPSLYGRVGNPKFSTDGNKIYFSFHPNGKSQDDLMEYDPQTNKVSTLLSNGLYNSFPVIDTENKLYFVSNATGVDNLYRFNGPHEKPTLITNLTSGIAYPVFGPNKDSQSSLYGSIFSHSGWGLAQIELLEHPHTQEEVSISTPPAPPQGQLSSPSREFKKEYPEESYSIFPSVFPRGWGPFLSADSSGVEVGGMVLGYDAVNRHRYLLEAGYNPRFQLTDAYALYSNRAFGPDFSLSSQVGTQYIVTGSDSTNFSRKISFSAAGSFPILWTYSNLTPTFSFNMERLLNYQHPNGTSDNNLISSSSFIPTTSFLLGYSNLVTSNLALTSESGRATYVGTKAYFINGEADWKAMFIDQEHIYLGNHWTLNPSIKGIWSTHLSSDLTSANANLSGRIPQNIFGTFAGDGFDQLSIRGYPNTLFSSKAAGVASLDLFFPIARIFGGWGTNPVFLDNLYGFAFLESGYFPYSGVTLPSTGGGLRLSTEISFFPLVLSLEYHQGLKSGISSNSGASDLFFQAMLGALSF